MDLNNDVINEASNYFLGIKKISDIPFITDIATGVGTSLYSKVQKVKENNYYKKLRILLIEIDKLTDTERLRFLEELGDHRDDFLSKVFIELDNLDDENKAPIYSKLLRNRILKFINSDDFQRLTLAIEKTYIKDILMLIETYNENEIEIISRTDRYIPFEQNPTNILMINNLTNVGILDVRRVGTSNEKNGNVVAGHNPTYLGELLIRYGQ